MKWFLSLQLLYLALITPIIHDFYNYDMEKAEFAGLFAKFTQAITDFSVQKCSTQRTFCRSIQITQNNL
jgi:hypothetical protein